MAVLCKGCCDRMEISTPPVRTRSAVCDKCGGDGEIIVGRSAGMNYDIPDIQIPGNRKDPNSIAEKEEQANGR